jgi:hypothetical protein
MRRRDFLAAGATTVTAIGGVSRAFAQGGGDMYGLIGKMTAAPAKRKHTSEANAIWITEAWDNKASHDA